MKAVMPVPNLAEARSYHFQKRYAALRDRAANPNALDFLNTALLDGNESVAEEYKRQLSEKNMQYQLTTVSEFIRNKNRMKIAYLLPHSKLTGGIKILIEQSNRLADKGHDVSLYSHSPKPDWIQSTNPYFFVHPDCALYELVHPCDIVIAGYWDLVEDAMRIKSPLKYHFAQGDFDIFDYDGLDAELKDVIMTAYTLPLKIITVSKYMQQKLTLLFDRESVVIPNAVDGNVFYPKETQTQAAGSGPVKFLLVGRDATMFKGHAVILAALHQLQEKGVDFEIDWVTPVPLSQEYSRFGLSVRAHIALPQDKIRELYQAADIYIGGSYYESFSLPPLEAMACGAAVIASDSGGIREYAKNGSNCLMYEPGNVQMLAMKIEALIKDMPLRQKLICEGLATAKKYNWANSIRLLDAELKSTVSTQTRAVRI